MYGLPWYTFILTFINVIDTEHPQNESGKLWLTVWAIEAVEKKY